MTQDRPVSAKAATVVGLASLAAAMGIGRFGFTPEKTAALRLPGLDAQHRLLGHELRPGQVEPDSGPGGDVLHHHWTCGRGSPAATISSRSRVSIGEPE